MTAVPESRGPESSAYVTLEDPRPTGPIRRLKYRRAVARLLRAIGILVQVPLLAVGLLGLAVLLLGDDYKAQGAIISAALPVAFLLGCVIWSRKRSHILYLRAFAHPGVDDVVTRSATSAVGRYYHLLTLDDDKLRPIGVPLRDKIRAWIVPLVSVPLTTWALYSLWIRLDRAVQEAVESGAGNLLDEADPSSFVEGAATVFAGAMAGALAGVVVGVLLGTIFLFVAYVGAWLTIGPIVRVVSITVADRWKRSQVKSPDDLQRVKRRLAKRRRRRWSPRLQVVNVHDDYWKDTVGELASESLGILMDLSYPSEGLYWEAERLLETDSRACVLVADTNEFRAWFEGDDVDELTERFGKLLGGRAIIPFDRGDPDGGKRFRKSLRTAFDSCLVESRAQRRRD